MASHFIMHSYVALSIIFPVDPDVPSWTYIGLQWDPGDTHRWQANNRIQWSRQQLDDEIEILLTSHRLG